MDNRFKSLVIATLALAAPLLAACTPDRPETALNWDDEEHVETRRLAPLPKPRPQKTEARTARHEAPKTYIYEGDSDLVPAPKPRPRFAATTAVREDDRDARPVLHPRGDVSFVWPLSGTVISGFGATTNGGRNDGINIAAAMDAPIHASAGGTVTYAGNELKGYGNLLLIKHADGYVTAYAHADRLLVGRGDTVARGQVIGYAGSTGDVDSPQLHFEIRHDTMPVNPKSLLVARNS